MSASKAVHAARAAGVELRLDGDDLVLKASAPPPAEVLDLLSRHKVEILPLLRHGRDGWSGDDWQTFFDERAGIAEFDGGLTRADAEVRAFACCVGEWLDRDPVRSPAGRCLGCGKDEQAYNPLLPFGTDVAGHVWLHSSCWPPWDAGRRAEAVAVLAAMGIEERKTTYEQQEACQGQRADNHRRRRSGGPKRGAQDHRRLAIRSLEQPARQSGGRRSGSSTPTPRAATTSCAPLSPR